MIILLITCGLAVSGIYFFRQKPKEASAEIKANEAKVDAALEKLVNKKQRAKARKIFEDTETMVQAFYDYPAKQQVDAVDLQKNPFSQFHTNSSTGSKELVSRRAQKRKLNKQLSGMKLKSVYLLVGFLMRTTRLDVKF